MTHYHSLDWIFYKEKALSQDKLEEMEDHLHDCDECMYIFLSLIDIEDIQKAEESIPSNFNQSVMNNLNKIEPIKKLKPKNKKINYQFGYYIAVASVTIILTFTGFYSRLVDAVPEVSKSVVDVDRFDKSNVVFSASQEIVRKTSSFINNFEMHEIYKFKEEK